MTVGNDGNAAAASNGSFPGGFAPFSGFFSDNIEPGTPSWVLGAYGKVNGVSAFPSFTRLTLTSGGGLNPLHSPCTSTSFCWLDCNGQFQEPSAETISFAAFHQGLTFAQASSLYTAVQAYRVTMGGGFV